MICIPVLAPTRVVALKVGDAKYRCQTLWVKPFDDLDQSFRRELYQGRAMSFLCHVYTSFPP